MVCQYKLSDYVLFYGSIYDTDKLSEIFNSTDIAAGSLAIHRLYLENASPIKTVEYFARGIPVIIGYNDNAVDKNCDFALKVPADESPIDMGDVIKFYRNISSPENSKRIRDFAEKNFT